MPVAQPGLLRIRLHVPDQHAADALRPYVVTHCPPTALKCLVVGKGVSLYVQTQAAALELWPHVFAYGKPAQLKQLREVLVVGGITPPPLKITKGTGIEWLYLGKLEKNLRHAGVNVVGDLTGKTEAELLALEDVSPSAVERVKESLKEYGLSLRQEE